LAGTFLIIKGPQSKINDERMKKFKREQRANMIGEFLRSLMEPRQE